MAKVSRSLTITVEPHTKGNFALTFADHTTRSDGGKRITTTEKTADMFQTGSVEKAVGLRFKDFTSSLNDEDPGALFAEEKKAKPRLDVKD
jgi:hypothetical protein